MVLILKIKMINIPIKYLKVIPLTNVLMVSFIMIFGFILTNLFILVMTLLYMIITGSIIHKYRTLYKTMELELSTAMFIVLIFISVVLMIIILALNPNANVINMLIGLGIGMLIQLTHIIICLK